MNHFDWEIKTILGWKTLTIRSNGLVYIIPSRITLDELTITPPLTHELAINIIKHYSISAETRQIISEVFIKCSYESMLKEINKICENGDGSFEAGYKDYGKVKKIMDRYQPHKILSSILKGIARTGLKTQDEKLLYTFFSLQLYRLTEQPFDSESESALMKYSNNIIESIKHNLLIELTPADKIAKEFLAKTKGDWVKYMYFRCLEMYLFNIVPIPLNIVPNINNDYYYAGKIGLEKTRVEMDIFGFEEERSILEQKVNALKNDGIITGRMEKEDQIKEINVEISKLKPKSLLTPAHQQYSEKGVEASGKMLSLFTDCRDYIKYQYSSSLGMNSECPEHEAEIYKQYLQNVSHNSSSRSESFITYLLCQCQFCYRYRRVKTIANGEYGWHCERGDCKKKYRAWVKHLNSLKPHPICLSKLYRPD